MISMALADRLMAVFLMVLGLAMLWGGYVMERLEVRQIHPLSIPGLVPMGLGVLIAICGVLLFVSSGKSSAKDVLDLGNRSNLIWALVLCLVFSVVLVGWVPFYMATFLFISAFSARFTWPKSAEPGEVVRKCLYALAIGLVFSILISTLFQYAFLVRLP